LAAQQIGLASHASAANAPRVIAAIGPEGGFCDDEITSAAGAGWQPIDLGPRILRVETAAIWFCALAVHALGGPSRPPEGDAVAAE
jgi:RsmE family RNA methyltransferase